MNAEDLGRCVDPKTRRLIRININDARETSDTIDKLMGSDGIESRKRFFISKGKEL